MKDLENKNYYFKFISFFLVIVTISGTLYYLYFTDQPLKVKILGFFIIAFELYVLSLIKSEITSKSIHTYAIPQITKIVLVINDGEGEKEWLCKNAKSFLIGKSENKINVDIDLSDVQCNEYIAQEHAVMNYADGYWYIEDLSSKNGVGLKKNDDDYAYKLKPFISYKLDAGDVIYISKVKLLLR